MAQIFGCSERKQNCTITVDQLFLLEGKKVFGTNYEKDQFLEVRDKAEDSVIGGYYTFYPNGHLKSYHFFINMVTYVYKEEYDINGEQRELEGIPLVYNIAEFPNRDSLYIKAYFFTLNKNYGQISVKTMNGRSFLLHLQKDTLFSNMSYVYFGFDFGGFENIEVYFSASYENTCLNKLDWVRDTIHLHYPR